MSRKLFKVMALVFAMVLALSGCNLVRVDENMEGAEVVATFNGGTLTKGELLPIYQSNKEYYEYLSSYYGYTFSTDGLLEEVANQLVEEKILLAKAEELGIALTDEEKAAAQEEAETAYEETVQSYWSSYAQDGLTDDEIRADIEAFFAQSDYTIDTVVRDTIEAKIVEKLEEHVHADVIVTPEDVQNEYNSLVAAAEASYTANLSSFEQDAMTDGTLIAWYPEGFRAVKHILRQFTTEQQSAISDIETEIADLQSKKDALTEPDATAEVTVTDGEAAVMNAEDIQKLIDAKTAEKEALIAQYVAEMQPTLDEIYARIAAGEDFEALMEEYNEDPGMDSEPAKTNGYYVSAESTAWVTAFRDGAMSIANVGEVSEPAISSYGVHIIRYMGDVTPGAVEYSSVSAQIEEDITAEMQAAAYTETVEIWVKDANVQLNLKGIEE